MSPAQTPCHNKSPHFETIMYVCVCVCRARDAEGRINSVTAWRL